MHTEILDPNDILFTQPTIEAFFSKEHEGSIFELASRLSVLQKTISDVDITPIRAALVGGKYHCIDNRRLWVAKKVGLPLKVQVIERTNEELRMKLASLKSSDGTSVQVILHCKLCGRKGFENSAEFCQHVAKHRSSFKYIPLDRFRYVTYDRPHSETWCPTHKEMDGKVYLVKCSGKYPCKQYFRDYRSCSNKYPCKSTLIKTECMCILTKWPDGLELDEEKIRTMVRQQLTKRKQLQAPEEVEVQEMKRQKSDAN